jgi:hypothetical protein
MLMKMYKGGARLGINNQKISKKVKGLGEGER